MSDIMGAIESVVGDIAGGMTGSGGGNFLTELMNALEGGGGQSSSNASGGSNSSGSSSTGSEIMKIAGDVLPIVAAFL
jgi:hypothetical protein